MDVGNTNLTHPSIKQQLVSADSVGQEFGNTINLFEIRCQIPATAISVSVLKHRNALIFSACIKTIFEYVFRRSMRYYAEIEVLKDLETMRRHPYVFFANDLIYFICREYGLEWIPYEFNKPVGVVETVSPQPRTYLPHPESFLDCDMQYGMKCLFKVREERFREKYRLLVPDGAEDKLERFVDHVHDIHDRAFELEYTPGEMFHLVAYLARLTVLFYEDGSRDAAHLAPSLIADALRTVMYSFDYKTVFRLMNESAIQSIDKYYMASGIISSEDIDCNYDESDDDNSYDESDYLEVRESSQSDGNNDESDYLEDRESSSQSDGNNDQSNDSDGIEDENNDVFY